METQATSVISKQKITHSLSKYIWESPILKSLIYNPFILALLTLLIVWLMDFFYGKRFKKSCPGVCAQHAITTYIIIACCVAMNNILIKHKYRLEKVKHEELEQLQQEQIPQYIQPINQ